MSRNILFTLALTLATACMGRNQVEVGPSIKPAPAAETILSSYAYTPMTPCQKPGTKAMVGTLIVRNVTNVSLHLTAFGLDTSATGLLGQFYVTDDDGKPVGASASRANDSSWTWLTFTGPPVVEGNTAMLFRFKFDLPKELQSGYYRLGVPGLRSTSVVAPKLGEWHEFAIQVC